MSRPCSPALLLPCAEHNAAVGQPCRPYARLRWCCPKRHAAAEEAGIAVPTIRVQSGEQVLLVTAEQRALLGTAPDAVVGVKIGRSREFVTRARGALGIPRYKRSKGETYDHDAG